MGTIIGNLEGITESTADNAVAQAGQAISDAFALGMSSAAVTAAFEALLPERLNTLNGIGPMLATMAGFEDVSAAIREPLYRAAFGKSAEYKFNAQFTPNLPDAHTAAQWLARGIITVAQYNVLFVASGVKPAYRPREHGRLPAAPAVPGIARRRGGFHFRHRLERRAHVRRLPADRHHDPYDGLPCARFAPDQNAYLSAL